MEITVLGSGTITSSLRRNASGLAVRASASWLLVDIGPGTLRRLCEARIDNRWIDVIFLTHFHTDHVSDLAPFLFASNYEFGERRQEPFFVVGPQGVEQFYQGLVGTYGDWVVPKGERLRVIELKADGLDAFTRGGVTVRSAPSAHTFPSLSYRIEADGVSVTVSGDTDVSEKLVDLARNTDLLICESSLPAGQKVEGHLIPSEAGRIATAAGARRLVLTHFYPPCDVVDVVEEAAATFSGDIVRAEDLLVVRV
jgi:ribonuclease BN (tRNA processing enzyme)